MLKNILIMGYILLTNSVVFSMESKYLLNNFFEQEKSTGTNILVYNTPSKAVINLTLDEVIENVVFYNPSIEKARFEWLSKCKEFNAATGVFEPTLVGSYEYSDIFKRDTTAEYVQQGYKNIEYYERDKKYKLGIEGKIPTGSTYNIGYSQTYYNTTLVSDEVEDFAGINITQPLGKGLWFGAPLQDIKVAKTDEQIAFHTYRIQLIQAIFNAENLYWNLAASQQKYSNALISVDIAKKLVTISKESFQNGLISESEFREAEAGLSIRIASEANAMQELMDAINQLKILLTIHKIDKKSLIYTTTDLLFEDKDKEIFKNTSTSNVSKNILDIQPNYIVKLYELEKGEIKVNYQKDQCLPEINLEGSLGYNGSEQNQTKALQLIKDYKYPNWSLGVQMKILFSGKNPRNLLKAAELEKKALTEELKATEYEILNSLELLSERIIALKQRIENTQKVVDIRKNLLDIEFLRLPMGKSNVHVIYEDEDKLIAAKQEYIDSIVKYKQAVGQYRYISGTTLQDRELERIKDGKILLSEKLLKQTNIR